MANKRVTNVDGERIRESTEMRNNSIWLATACTLAIAALVGCKREATGQVAAIVNGEEITLQEINQELGSARLSNGVDRKGVQQAALQRVIDRRLAAEDARDQEVDKDPEYLLRKRQVDELLLIQMSAQKAARALRTPAASALDKYIADHPSAFGERAIYTLDRLQFPTPANPAQLRALESDHSMDAVAAHLRTMGINFQRGETQVDTARLAPEVIARIKALPAGEPFIIADQAGTTVGVITATRPNPLTVSDARPLAAQAVRNEELAKIFNQRLKAARASAKIDYQPGFAPPLTPNERRTSDVSNKP